MKVQLQISNSFEVADVLWSSQPKFKVWMATAWFKLHYAFEQKVHSWFKRFKWLKYNITCWSYSGFHYSCNWKLSLKPEYLSPSNFFSLVHVNTLFFSKLKSSQISRCLLDEHAFENTRTSLFLKKDKREKNTAKWKFFFFIHFSFHLYNPHLTKFT